MKISIRIYIHGFTYVGPKIYHISTFYFGSREYGFREYGFDAVGNIKVKILGLVGKELTSVRQLRIFNRKHMELLNLFREITKL